MTTDTLLDRVLAPGGLSVMFQPIVRRDADGWHLHSVEGLVRGPLHTNLHRPDVLFAYARRRQAEALVDRACVQAILESAAPLGTDLSLNVNVHGVTLEQDPRFVEHLADLLTMLGMAPSHLTVEIVEYSASACGEEFALALQALRSLGVGIALDDIGLGQSNYRMIVETRPDYFKVDRYLVAGCASDPYRRAILGSIGHLAAGLGAQAVAEGIDTLADLNAVQAEGVRFFQGYLFARPRPAQAFGPAHELEAATHGLPGDSDASWPASGDWITIAVERLRAA